MKKFNKSPHSSTLHEISSITNKGEFKHELHHFYRRFTSRIVWKRF